MKKILIVTLQGDNIGNRLQNYALQTILERFGCESYTAITGLHEFELYRSKFKFLMQVFLGRLGIKKYEKYFNRFKRIKKYRKFNKKYIHNMVKTGYNEAFKEEWQFIDYAISGSDQVWHRWSSNDKELRYFYLEFLPKDKRVSYAPSFGFDEFPKRDVNLHFYGINNIKHLSCREQSGAELIKQLTNRNAKLVLDPTLLITKDEWIRIEKKPIWLQEENHYVLTYFLGDKKEYLKSISKFTKENNLKIVEAYNPEIVNSQLITPDEFIYLIDNADFVCTDSFHATVFSLIFRKKFLSFKRNDYGMNKMFDRIENIQNIFGVNRVYNGDIYKLEEEININPIDKYIDISLDYIRQSLDI